MAPLVKITKQETLDLLSGLRATVIYAFVLMHDSQADSLAEKIEGRRFAFESNGRVAHALDLTTLADLLRSPAHLQTIRSNLAIILKHTLVHRTHEFVCAYCEASGQFDRYRAQPWFQFARIVRNVLAHGDGTTLRDWPKDLSKRGIQFVEWRGLRIEASQVAPETGVDTGVAALQPAQMIQLHEDIAGFLQTLD